MIFIMWTAINLDKNNILLADPTPLYKNYTNLDFDAEHLKRDWKRGVVNFVMPFFFKESALFGKYQMLPWYSRLGSVDIFSKYAWVVHLKDVKGVTITNAFQKVWDKSDCEPNKIWVGKGSELYNSSFKNGVKTMI